MKYKILFINSHSLYPYIRTGAEETIHSLLCFLNKVGHTCIAVGCKEEFMLNNGIFDEDGVIETFYEPYNITLINSKEIFLHNYKRIIGTAAPDIIITQSDSSHLIIGEAIDKKIPVILYLHSLERGFTNESCFKSINKFNHKIDAILSCSKYIANELFEKYHLNSTVLYPAISLGKYKCINNKEKKKLTLINSHEKKGIELVLQLAFKYKNEEFMIVESWGVTNYKYKKIIEKMKNVTILQHQSDIKKIYEETKLLLVPSLCEEAFSRVIIEARVNNIPFIANNIGGISEAADGSGKLIPYPYDINDWYLAIEELLGKDNNPESYNEKLDKFSTKIIANQLQDIITNILSNSK